MNATGPVIEVKGLTKVYRTEEVETHALTGIELTIDPGEYIVAMGPSGCGKTTLLSILGLLETPTAGEYRITGTPVETLNAAERARVRNRHIGFVFQAFNLIGDLTVEENVELPLVYRGSIPRAERRDKVRTVLEEVGMGHRLRHYPGQLSGGQQQRVAIARALVGEPSILLADEPTGNLDSKSGEAVMELLAALHEKGATLFMVTHDPHYARFARRIIRLMDGQIVDDAETQEESFSSGLTHP
ncbi:MAG: ABC transporter ATP-binding protein [Gammaproteobacteria bacterium]|jgi:putative ABC transport system ATP-binding protein|nr:ABC transporter ATP-binding protein [Gammaproteobacteria bacterium]